jgi:hypothetical protein
MPGDDYHLLLVELLVSQARERGRVTRDLSSLVEIG